MTPEEKKQLQESTLDIIIQNLFNPTPMKDEDLIKRYVDDEKRRYEEAKAREMFKEAPTPQPVVTEVPAVETTGTTGGEQRGTEKSLLSREKEIELLRKILSTPRS